MKRILVLLLAALLLLSFAACGGDKPEETKGGNTPSLETQEKPAPSTQDQADPIVETTVDISSWGKEDKYTTDDGVMYDRYLINLPHYLGSHFGYCKISEQQDGTVALISGQDMDSPKVEKQEEILPSYTNQMISSLESMYGVRSSNYNIAIDDSKIVTIGDHEMCVYKGKITYDYKYDKGETQHRVHQYVAYATLLKESGNCAYWLVYDFSNDQSKGDLIAEHALNMAKTFREE